MSKKNHRKNGQDGFVVDVTLEDQGKDPRDIKFISESRTYNIKKYGLYQYQVFEIGDDGSETPAGAENVYGVVASDLIDLMWRDLTKGVS